MLATGESHAVREFVECAFAVTGREIQWRGAGTQEKGIEAKTGKTLVEIEPRYFRPTEVDSLLDNASKAWAKLGWRHTVSFGELVKEMVAEDLKAVAGERDRKDRL